MKMSTFRLWVSNMYHDSVRERMDFREKIITLEEYWNTNKFWLKAKFKRQNKNDN